MPNNKSLLILIVFSIFVALSEKSHARMTTYQSPVCTPCIEEGTCSEHKIKSQTIIEASEDALQKCVLRQADVSRPAMLDQSSSVGQVVVRVVLNKRGQILNAQCVSGPPIGYQAVLNSVRHWKFKRLKLPGNAERISGELTINFDFRSSPPTR
jgi:outer membrane biosynthesis protein TonB